MNHWSMALDSRKREGKTLTSTGAAGAAAPTNGFPSQLLYCSKVGCDSEVFCLSWQLGIKCRL